MRYINEYDKALDVFQALSSPVRVQILELLLKNGRMSMNDLAEALGLSNGALTPHVKRLETGDLIRVHATSDGHGNQKVCEPHLEKILFHFGMQQGPSNEYRAHLRVGQYSSCKVYPTCGLSTSEALIGDADDARYFSSSKHFEADILWFTMGYVEYMIPCIIPADAKIQSLSVSMELSSEAPGSNANWPSDIHFHLNDHFLGSWTSPGDYADVPGLFTPSWWFSNWNQYGLLKTLSVRRDGTYMDDLQISTAGIDSLHLNSHDPMMLRISVPSDSAHVGGLTLFGRGFGNYNQDIDFRITYSQED